MITSQTGVFVGTILEGEKNLLINNLKKLGRQKFEGKQNIDRQALDRLAISYNRKLTDV